MTSKRCPDCEQTLPLSAFTRNRRNTDGLAFYCAPCSRARVNASRRRRLGPPRSRNGQGPRDVANGFKWCPECDVIKAKSEFPKAPSQANGVGAYCNRCFNVIREANRAKRHGSTRNYHLKHRYGITVDDFDRMFAEQDGLCAICGEAPAAHVDHDHETGRVRGLLCFNCNGALGQFRDREDLMVKAVVYLRQAPTRRFVAPPSDVVGFHLGPTDTGRPDGEPWPVDHEDESGAA